MSYNGCLYHLLEDEVWYVSGIRIRMSEHNVADQLTDALKRSVVADCVVTHLHVLL